MEKQCGACGAETQAYWDDNVGQWLCEECLKTARKWGVADGYILVNETLSAETVARLAKLLASRAQKRDTITQLDDAMKASINKLMRDVFKRSTPLPPEGETDADSRT